MTAPTTTVPTTAGDRPPAAARPRTGSRPWWSGATPVPTLRAAGLLAVLGVASGIGPAAIGVWPPLLVVLALVAVDAVLAPPPWQVGLTRELPAVLPLDGSGDVVWRLDNPTNRSLTVAVADELTPSLGAVTRRFRIRLPAGGRGRARTALSPTRRGTFRPSQATVRVAGPLGLAVRQATRSLTGRIEVHPSFRSRDTAELRIRRARILDEGLRSVRGRGGGTEFEALWDYV